jgi:hypothetical protein
MVWARPASAHGGIPRAQGIFFEPENPSNIILRSDVWGFFQSTNAGESWSWSCAEVYGGQSTSTQKRSFALLPGGEGRRNLRAPASGNRSRQQCIETTESA